jgi:hypothetical protein
MHRVFNKQLHMFAYKVQITKELKQDKPKWLDFTTDMLHWINMNPGSSSEASWSLMWLHPTSWDKSVSTVHT